MKRLPFLFWAFIFLFPSVCPAKELPKIAVWDLAALGIPSEYAKQLTEILAGEIVKIKKYEVISQENVRTLAGWEAQKMQLGCTDAKCLTALGQMDVTKLISGSAGKIGNRYTVSLSLFDTQNVRSENKLTDYCRSEDELIELVQATLRKLLGEEMVSPPPPAQSKIGPPGQATGMPIAPPQATVVSMASFQSYNFRNHFIRHANFLGEITPVSSELDRKDSTFRIVPGLADSYYVSFESVNYPGHYLRHQDFRLKLQKFDGSQLFRQEATFKMVPGLADGSWSSFESVNYPGHYIRHKNFHLYLERGSDDLFRKDSTFRAAPPNS